MALQIMTGYCCIDVNQPNIQAGDALQARRFAEAAEVFEKSIRRMPTRQAKFEPAQKDRVAVPVVTLIEYDFKEIAAADK